MDTVDAPARRGLRRLIDAQAGGLPRPFWWLWLGTLVNRAGTFIEPFFVLYLTTVRGESIRTTGLVLTVWGFGSLLSQPIGGVLTDRFGRRPTLAASLAATATSLFALGLARDLVTITALVLVLGIAADMYRPASSAAVTDLVPEADRTRAFALQFWAVNLGFSVASVSAGLLLHLGYGVLFTLDAATTLAFGLLALRFVPETRPETDDAPARLLDPIRLFRADRLLLAATGLVLGYAVLYAQVGISLPLAITHAGLSASFYGYAIAINGVLIVIGQPLTLRLLDRWPRHHSLPDGMALVGVGLAATGLCHRPWQYALSVVVWTVGEIATAGSFQALIASLAPAHMRGRYAGALGVAWGASGLLAPVLGASGFAASPRLFWSGCLVVGLLAAWGQNRLLLAIDRRFTPTPLAPARLP
ncbi:MAG TPA: MFS transporter [Jatrophihabitans sp.]|jgi:MFS family permease|uniref:MDR family MFS transporter n=1 Tax=Jatrophihabitans sp. TaxID=1932789 RepID=UPI002DFEDB12|nr:MFS transporter [Jatrophihabitans sp.]